MLHTSKEEDERHHRVSLKFQQFLEVSSQTMPMWIMLTPCLPGPPPGLLPDRPGPRPRLAGPGGVQARRPVLRQQPVRLQRQQLRRAPHRHVHPKLLQTPHILQEDNQEVKIRIQVVLITEKSSDL